MKRKEKEDAPLELASLFVRLVRNGALEDGTEEQKPPRAVIQLLVAHAMVLQHIVYDLARAYSIRGIQTKGWGNETDLAQHLHDFEASAAPRCKHDLTCHIVLECFELFLARIAFRLRALNVLHDLLHTQPTIFA